MSVENISNLANGIEVSLDGAVATIPSLILTALLCAFIALFGFKFLKIEICLAGAIIGYNLGSVHMAPLLGDSVHTSVVIIISVALAILGAVLSAKIYKIMVFIYVAFAAFIVGALIFTSFVENLFDTGAGSAIVILLSVLFAIVVAHVVCKFFKPIYIVLTSYAGMVLMFNSLALIIAPSNDTLITVMTLIGLVATVPAAISQFRSCRDLEF